MNNIGGIIQCEILNIDDVIVFATINQAIQIKKKETAEWQKLPINLKHTTATSTPTAGDAGMLYEHKFSAILPTDKVTQTEIGRYRSLCITGCLLRYTDANGNKRMLGTAKYPLTGTITQTSGKSAASLAGYELNLKSSELTPALPYVEI